MGNMLRWRFWVELALALGSGALFLVTLVGRNWIEIVFAVDPDAGSGQLEWLIVCALLVLTVTTSALARYEWRRRTAVPA